MIYDISLVRPGCAYEPIATFNIDRPVRRIASLLVIVSTNVEAEGVKYPNEVQVTSRGNPGFMSSITALSLINRVETRYREEEHSYLFTEDAITRLHEQFRKSECAS